MSQPASNYHISGWAITLNFIAAVLLIATGIITAFYGGWELLFGGVEKSSDTLIDLSARTWGAVHLGLGALMVLAGSYIFTGRTWARIIGIIVAAVVLLASIGPLPESPVWSLFLIVFNAAVIWALAFHGQDVKDLTG